MEVSKHTTLYWLPLELLDKRYTILTRKWYSEKFKKSNFKLVMIEGQQLLDEIKEGSFLDCCSTIHYKSTQIAKFAKMASENKIEKNSIVFVDDIWFPGIKGIRYIEGFKKLNLKLYGVLHAGSYVPSDDVATKLDKKWTRKFEECLFELFDGIFVGSNFHKKLVERTFKKKFNNIHVTGLPFEPDDVRCDKDLSWESKDNIVIFPHRIHPEKQPYLFDKLQEQVKKQVPNVEFIKTMEHNLSKRELYKLMSKSKVMFSAALQENFGFSTLECCSVGCIPIVPNRLVYPEFYPEELLYNNFQEAVRKTVHFLKNKPTPELYQTILQIPNKFKYSIDRMLEVMKNG